MSMTTDKKIIIDAAIKMEQHAQSLRDIAKRMKDHARHIAEKLTA